MIGQSALPIAQSNPPFPNREPELLVYWGEQTESYERPLSRDCADIPTLFIMSNLLLINDVCIVPFPLPAPHLIMFTRTERGRLQAINSNVTLPQHFRVTESAETTTVGKIS